MRRKKGKERRVSGDAATQELMDDGVFSVKGQAQERPPPAQSNPSYSILSGIKYTFFLSLFLWWFPLVGNMAAGYVGGRRSGAAWKGVIAAVFPLVVIWGFFFCKDHGLLPTLITTIVSIPGIIDSAMLHDLPALAPYYQAGILYVGAFLVFLQSMLQYQVNLYLVTIVFAYLGGAVSELRQKEYAMYGGSSSAHVTLNFLHARGDSEDDEETSSSDESEPGPSTSARPKKVHAPKERSDMIPTGLRAYPNWRRRRLKGETDKEIVAPVTRRQLDPVERLDREGVHLKATGTRAAQAKMKAHRMKDSQILVEDGEERTTSMTKKGEEDDEGNDEDRKPEKEDEAEDEGKLTAVDRAISRYMQGGKAAMSSPPAHQEKNWDVL